MKDVPGRGSRNGYPGIAIIAVLMAVMLSITLWFALSITPFNLLAASPEQVVYNISGLLDSQNKFIQPFVGLSGDNVLNIFIKIGTQVIPGRGGSVRQLLITRLSALPSPPPENSYALTACYKFEPTGNTFNPSIPLTITYDAAAVPAGFPQSDLVITYWEKAVGPWRILENPVIDTVNHTITSQITELAPYTVIAYKRPATFVPSELSVTPEVKPGQEVTISLLITNIGYVSGTADVILRIADEQIAVQKVDINPKSSQRVFFYISRENAGRYNISVNGLTGSFVVKAPTLTPTTSPSPPPVAKPTAPPAVPTPKPSPSSSSSLPPPAPGPVTKPATPLPPPIPTNWVPLYVILAVIVLSPVAWWLYGRLIK